MEITEGLLDHMVLQRNRRDVSDAAFAGTCEVSGALMARVTCGGSAVEGLEDAKVGRAAAGQLKGRLKGPVSYTHLTLPTN